MGSLRHRRVLSISSVTVKRRKSWLLAASALAPLSLGVSEPALAQCVGIGTSTVTCPAGLYPNGIAVAQPVAAVTDLNVTLRSGVTVTGLAPLSPNAVDIFNQSVAPTDTFVVMENGAIINVTNVNGTGLHLQIGALGPPVQQTGGNATVTAAGTITVQSTGFRQDAIGVFTSRTGAGANVIYTGPSGGNVGGALDLISSGASNGTIIQAHTQGASGNAFVHASGNMLGFLDTGNQFFQGLGATADGDGNATVLYDKGTITVQGRSAVGIFAGNGGEGLVTVVTGPDTHIINRGTNPGESTPTLTMSPGITAESGGHAAAGSKITATVASTIEMFGPVTAATSFRTVGVGRARGHRQPGRLRPHPARQALRGEARLLRPGHRTSGTCRT